MSKVKLGDVCCIVMGQSPDSSTYNEIENGMPFFQGNADFGELHPTVRIWCSSPKKTAKKGDILISVRAPIGALNIADRDCCIGRGLASISADNYNRKYIWYFLESKVTELNNKGTGSTFKAIGKSVLSETEIKDLPIEEQNSIVYKLDLITDLINKTKKQVEKLDELIKSRFVEMFGDPLSPVKISQVSSLGEQFKISSGGTPSTKEKKYWENGTIPWIGSNLCQNNILYDTDGKYITEEGYNNSSAKWFYSGYVIIALVGATIGKVALLKTDTTTNQNIVGINVNENRMFCSEFVFYHLQFLYPKFMQIGDDKFKMANQRFIRELPILCPPIEFQNQFADFVEQVEKQKSAVQKSIEKLEVLKKSLMQEYFG